MARNILFIAFAAAGSAATPAFACDMDGFMGHRYDPFNQGSWSSTPPSFSQTNDKAVASEPNSNPSDSDSTAKASNTEATAPGADTTR